MAKAIPFEISCISAFDSLRVHESVDIQKWDQRFSNLYSTATRVYSNYMELPANSWIAHRFKCLLSSVATEEKT
jgi:hypothetical protein